MANINKIRLEKRYTLLLLILFPIINMLAQSPGTTIVLVKDKVIMKWLGDGTYTVPANVKQIVVECWGAGGGGSGGATMTPVITSHKGPGAGGGGGAYSRSVLKNVSGETYSIVIGKGGAGGDLYDAVSPWGLLGSQPDRPNGKDGGFTRFSKNGTTVVQAGGGKGGIFRRTTDGGSIGGEGGCNSNSIGQVIHCGGNGASATVERAGAGGGAGGSSSPGGNGGNANSANDGQQGGKRGACCSKAAGGGGEVNYDNNSSSNGSSKGGGGGGGYKPNVINSTRDGGKGADGGVRITEIYEGAPNLWFGCFSNEWHHPSNWIYKEVPDLSGGTFDLEFVDTNNSEDGFITHNDLVLPHDLGEVSINNYTNHSNKKLIISSGSRLTILGDINVNNNNSITIESEKHQSTTHLPAGSLIISNVSNENMPQATVKFYSKAYINNGANSGNKYNWQHFGIPVQHLTAASPTFTGAYVRKYDESIQSSEVGKQWVSLTETSQMYPFAGYEIVQSLPKTYEISGKLVGGDFSYKLTRTSGSKYPGQHILSNSYAASMRISDMEFGDKLEKTVYIYNTGTLNKWSEGVIGVESDGNYIAVPKEQASPMNASQIPPMQGFLIRITEPTADEDPNTYLNGVSDADLTVSYQYSKLTHNTGNHFLRSTKQSGNNKTMMFASLRSSHSTDCAWLFHEEHCTPGWDNGWDGHKIIAPQGVQLLISEGEELYQVSSTNNLDGATLGVISDERDSDYTLTLELKNIYPQYRTLWLHDRKTGAKVELKHGENSYRFEMSRNESNTDRFKIMSQKEAQLPMQPGLEGITLQVRDNTLRVNNHNNIHGTLTVVDATGRIVIDRHRINPSGTTTLPFALPSGVYISKTVCDGNMEVKKFVK